MRSSELLLPVAICLSLVACDNKAAAGSADSGATSATTGAALDGGLSATGAWRPPLREDWVPFVPFAADAGTGATAATAVDAGAIGVLGGDGGVGAAGLASN